MAPNGSSRKTPAPMTNGKPSAVNFVSKNLFDDGFSNSDKGSKLKLKEDATKKLAKISKPGEWDSEITTNKPKDVTAPASRVNKVPVETAKAFTNGRPMEDKPDLVKCNHCRRAILRHRAKAHVEDCIAKKQEKQRRKKEAKDARDADRRRAERGGESSSEEEEVLTGSKTASKTDDAQAGKKRKAEDMGEGSKKKKSKKDEPKAKAPRPKAPVDVERQCGVELPQGGQCARSLTCKSHSMGAKRAVPGRSAPYDKLLAEYQRKNQAKLQKAALDAQAPNPDDELAPTGPIDSDEEKDLVLAAIARSRPQPLYQPTIVPLRRKYQHVRLKEMLGNALSGRNGGGLFGTASASG